MKRQEREIKQGAKPECFTQFGIDKFSDMLNVEYWKVVLRSRNLHENRLGRTTISKICVVDNWEIIWLVS